MTLAAASGFSAVALGAFGAHALKQRLPADLLAVWQTAVQYQFWHTLALFAVALWLGQGASGRLVHTSGWLFAAGIIVFSGSLYILCLSGQRWLGAITPIGGTLWLAAWACLCYSAWRGQ
jgi:uncharacterized membrane protein YgdD (TMEM256/DUF423 family)